MANGPGEPVAAGPPAGGAPRPNAEDILADCRRQRRRALSWAAISGVLLVALVAATLVAAARDAYHGVAVILIPVLIVLNLVRLAQCRAALVRIGRAERLVHQAQERYRPGDGGAR